MWPKRKKMNTFSCCSPFWVSINRCIKTNDCKKCPLSKSPFPLSFSQSIKDSWLVTTYRQLRPWGAQSVFSKQQIIDTNSVTDSIQIQLSRPLLLSMSPPISSRLCSSTQCCLYIISVSPSLCLHYWADWCCQNVRCMIGPLSPLSDNSVWPRI